MRSISETGTHFPVINIGFNPLQAWNDVIASNNNNLAMGHEVADETYSIMGNQLVATDMMTITAYDADLQFMQRQKCMDIKIILAHRFLKNLMAPNILMDNSFFVSISMNKDFFSSVAGKRFVIEEVDSNFIFDRKGTRNFSCLVIPSPPVQVRLSSAEMDGDCITDMLEYEVGYYSDKSVSSAYNESILIGSSRLHSGKSSFVTANQVDMSGIGEPQVEHAMINASQHATLEVGTLVRRCTRLHNEGYKQEILQIHSDQAEVEPIILEEEVVSRKLRRHTTAPVDVQPVRRSNRSKRYQEKSGSC
jgi:hypothetical protein